MKIITLILLLSIFQPIVSTELTNIQLAHKYVPKYITKVLKKQSKNPTSFKINKYSINIGFGIYKGDEIVIVSGEYYDKDKHTFVAELKPSINYKKYTILNIKIY